MKEKAKRIIGVIFGTEKNISVKCSFSLFATGVLFFTIAIMFAGNENTTVLNIFEYASGISFALWLISAQENDSFMSVF